MKYVMLMARAVVSPAAIFNLFMECEVED
jgi:hypothetical protein